MNPSERIKELKIDNTLWAKPTKLVNLLDFNPEKLTIDKSLIVFIIDQK